LELLLGVCLLVLGFPCSRSWEPGQTQECPLSSECTPSIQSPSDRLSRQPEHGPFPNGVPHDCRLNLLCFSWKHCVCTFFTFSLPDFVDLFLLADFVSILYPRLWLDSPSGPVTLAFGFQCETKDFLCNCPLRVSSSSWAYSKVVRKSSKTYETARFLLDHPRRCFIYMFPSRQTWLLFAILIAIKLAMICSICGSTC
jgi:hypothetical protein